MQYFEKKKTETEVTLSNLFQNLLLSQCYLDWPFEVTKTTKLSLMFAVFPTLVCKCSEIHTMCYFYTYEYESSIPFCKRCHTIQLNLVFLVRVGNTMYIWQTELGSVAYFKGPLEQSCHKKRQKNSNQGTDLGNRGRLKVLNDTKLILNEHEWPP